MTERMLEGFCKSLGAVSWYSDFVVEIAGMIGELWPRELNLAVV